MSHPFPSLNGYLLDCWRSGGWRYSKNGVESYKEHQTGSLMAVVYDLKPSYSSYQLGAHYHSEAVGHIGQKPKFLSQAKGKQKALSQNSRSLDIGIF